VVYFRALNGEVYGFDTETQQDLIDKAIADGWEDITGSWPPPPGPPPIPTTVSMRQARLALFQQGKLSLVQPLIDAMMEPAKTNTQISWDYARTVNRDDDLVVQLSAAMGLTDADLDALFILGASL